MTTVIGLTGGIATGKSTVAKMFVDLQIPVIDSDSIAKIVLQKNQEGYTEVIKEFGEDILFNNQEINRKKLAKLIFNDEQKRNLLNGIVHPKVKKIILSEIEKYNLLGFQKIVVDVPLLFESGFNDICDITIVVYTNKEEQLRRLMDRDHISKDYAIQKIASQLPLEEKKKLADYTIDNSFSILNTKKELVDILKNIEVIQ